MTPACRLNRNKSEVCFDRLAPVMERSRRMASNWSGVPQAGRRYIRPGRIIGLMGRSCVWTRRPSALFGGGKKQGWRTEAKRGRSSGPASTRTGVFGGGAQTRSQLEQAGRADVPGFTSSGWNLRPQKASRFLLNPCSSKLFRPRTTEAL